MKVTERRVARALRPGGPEVIEVSIEQLPPLEVGEVLVRVEAVGLNHAETLIRSGSYAVRLPFPFLTGRGRRGHGSDHGTGGNDPFGHTSVLGGSSRVVRDLPRCSWFHGCCDPRKCHRRAGRLCSSRRAHGRRPRPRLAVTKRVDGSGVGRRGCSRSHARRPTGRSWSGRDRRR